MSEDVTAISVQHVNKAFRLPHDKQTSIKGGLISLFRPGKRTFETQKVLHDVSFDIKEGEFFGIVGRNGSGKSTLLKLLAGIYTPDMGSIVVNGKLIPFIELGVGFNPELTGRENVFLNGALLGFSRQEMLKMYDSIVDFAELRRFMDQKLKNYSSGMQVRLAFSIAIRARGDILLIDEVLAVGDAAFQSKCFEYFYELKKKKATVVFVSHDRSSLERFCDRGVLINDGKIIDTGPIKQILAQYSSIVLDELEDAARDEATDMTLPQHEGKTYATIHAASATNGHGDSKSKFSFGESITVGFRATIGEPLDNPIFGITIWQKGLDVKPVFAINTSMNEETVNLGKFMPGENVEFTVTLPKGFADGEYYVEPGVANSSATVIYAQKQKAARFIVFGSNNPYSLFSSDDMIKLTRGQTG